jgi:hypothetical protein
MRNPFREPGLLEAPEVRKVEISARERQGRRAYRYGTFIFMVLFSGLTFQNRNGRRAPNPQEVRDAHDRGVSYGESLCFDALKECHK